MMNRVAGHGLLLVIACVLWPLVPAAAMTSSDEDLDTLARWLGGSYSSEKHARVDSTYENYDLHIARMWNDRRDGIWLMVEQAKVESPDTPVLQQVYRLWRVEDNMMEIEVYRWKNPQSVVGAWRDVAQVAGLSPGDLSKRRGCELYLQRDEVKYFGATHGTACPGGAAGVSYTTVDVQFAERGITIWERGFSPRGDQVAGPLKGPYYFLRQKP